MGTGQAATYMTAKGNWSPISHTTGEYGLNEQQGGENVMGQWTINIKGHRYYYHLSAVPKWRALELAKRLRKKGYLSRIHKTGKDSYDVLIATPRRKKGGKKRKQQRLPGECHR